MRPEERRKDLYSRLAREYEYSSRAAFKLLEIQERYRFLSPGTAVIEFGASPGGWTEVLLQLGCHPVFSIDLVASREREGVVQIRGDMTRRETRERLREEMSRLSLAHAGSIVSDAMVHTSGDRNRDHASSYLLCEAAMSYAGEFLSRGGSVLVKQFQGDMTQSFIRKHSGRFRDSRVVKPRASRAESSEVYILFTGFSGDG